MEDNQCADPRGNDVHGIREVPEGEVPPDEIHGNVPVAIPRPPHLEEQLEVTKIVKFQNLFVRIMEIFALLHSCADEFSKFLEDPRLKAEEKRSILVEKFDLLIRDKKEYKLREIITEKPESIKRGDRYEKRNKVSVKEAEEKLLNLWKNLKTRIDELQANCDKEQMQDLSDILKRILPYLGKTVKLPVLVKAEGATKCRQSDTIFLERFEKQEERLMLISELLDIVEERAELYPTKQIEEHRLEEASKRAGLKRKYPDEDGKKTRPWVAAPPLEAFISQCMGRDLPPAKLRFPNNEPSCSFATNVTDSFHEEPNRPIAVKNDNCPFLQFLVGDPSTNLPELTADEVDEFFRQEVAEERSKLKNASNQIPPKQKKMALAQLREVPNDTS